MNDNNKSKSFDEVIKEIKIGDIVSFKRKGTGVKLKGEVRDCFFKDNEFYLIIYSFFERKEITFILNKKFELITPVKFLTKKNKTSVIFYDLSKVGTGKNKFSRIILKTISVLILITLIFTINPNLKISLVSTSFSYEEFLSKELSLNKLFLIITTRLRYKYDVGEQWMTPNFAWNNRYGDCEEYASIFSDYFTHHNIENYIIGLNLKNNYKGHAVVIAKIDKSFYIIDPTFAVESAGIRKLKKITTLRGVISQYSTLPVAAYKVPSFNGEKKVISYIY